MSSDKDLKTALLAQAEKLGLVLHPNTSVANLVKTVNKMLTVELNGAPDAPMELKAAGSTSEARKEATRKVPVRIIPLDPVMAKQDFGQFQVGNDVIGTITQVVPFESEKPFHIAQALIPHIQEKKHRVTRYKTIVKNGREEEIQSNVLVPSYTVEIHPALTADEIESIRQRQLAEQRIS